MKTEDDNATDLKTRTQRPHFDLDVKKIETEIANMLSEVTE